MIDDKKVEYIYDKHKPHGTCVLWYPGIDIPVRGAPKAKHTLIPCNIVYIAYATPFRATREWFWLYVCSSCGIEYILPPSARYVRCICDAKYKQPVKHKWPQEAQSTCEYCGRIFT